MAKPGYMRRFWPALLACVLAACTPAAPPPPPPLFPQKIISVVPSATETLLALGMAKRIVAVGDYDQMPPGMDRLRIGGLLNPNIEKIIELRPDLVIAYGTQDVLRDRLGSVGIRLYPFTSGNIEHTLQTMTELGRILGAEDLAKEIVQRIQNTFSEIRAHAPAVHPKVLLVHSRGAGVLGSFYSVGSPAFQHELIEIAGGVNLFADVDKEIIQPSVEEIIARGPDVIVETLPSPITAKEINQRKADWSRLSKLPAVVKGRVYIVGEDYMLVPGPSLDEAARKFAELIGGN